MSQEPQAFIRRGEEEHLIPHGSVDLSSGDYVCMARHSDPISRARLGNESRVRPIRAAWDSQWGVGVVDTDFTTNTVGSTRYATPTASEAVPVLRKGVFRFAIVQTSGKAGDLVVFSSGNTGAQLFSLNNLRADVAIGRLTEDFSGATANDPQKVTLFEKPLRGRDIHFWLNNRALQGCMFNKHSVNGQASSQINAGRTGELNICVIKGKLQSIARVTDFTIGALNPGGQSAVRFYWLAVKASTTGGAVAFTKETCSGIYSAFASWTNSGISAGMMIPKTWTSNMVPLALLVGWSATQVSIGNDRILHMVGPNLPNGAKVLDHTTWYL